MSITPKDCQEDKFLAGEELNIAINSMEQSEDLNEIDELIESNASDEDIKALASTYKDINNGKVLSPEYSRYANSTYISPSWVHTTCDVIYTLEQINWVRMTLNEKIAFFSTIADAAKNKPKEYNKYYTEYVYAIIYQTFWAYAHRLHKIKNITNMEDIVQGALVKTVTNSNQIAQYDSIHAPSTFIKTIAKAAIDNEYYFITGSDKVNDRAKRDLVEIKRWLNYWGYESQNVPTWVYYWGVEMSRAQPRSFRDIDDIINGTGVKIMYDNLMSAKDLKDERKNPANLLIDTIDKTSLFQKIKNILSPKELAAFAWYTTIYLESGNQKERSILNKNPQLAEANAALIKLRNNREIRKFSREIGKRRGSAKLDLGKSRIPENVANDVGLGAIVDHIQS